MIRSVLGSRASIGGVLGSGRGGAAAAAWYLAGGVSAANCVAAYQPIGAASLAASYTNLANPGTYDAAPGVAPTFNTATGWGFTGTQWLTLGNVITGTGARTIIARYGGTSSQSVIVGLSAETLVSGALAEFNLTPEIALRISGGNRIWGSGTTSNVVVAVTGPASGSTSNLIAYKDGSALSPTSTAAANYNTGTKGAVIGKGTYGTPPFFSGSIQAVAIYNVALSAATVAALSAAMAAL